MPTLRFLLDDQVVLRHRMRGGRVLVGRADHCDVALPSKVISRVHCALEHDGATWWLVDRSRHGTFLGGARVQRAALAEGDVFRVGEYDVRFEPEAERPEPTREVVDASWEELVAVDQEVASRRVVLALVGGPLDGQRVELDRARGTLGGA
ncbi:MAG TPA: FHA domain-containing protein, partial [Myxococcota bacterium]|nr:FHA domain-containing protein [Myxococcota bacterium]